VVGSNIRIPFRQAFFANVRFKGPQANIRPCTEPGFYLIFTSPKAGPAHLPVLNSAVSLLTHVNLIRFGRAMLARTGVNMQIDADHSRAICLEIGERLGELMRRDAACELPARLRDLMERLAEADRETSPSLVPCLEDMTQQAPIDPRQEGSARELRRTIGPVSSR
jgi:hypothetical protein